MSAAPNLRLVVNAETGEVVEPDCQECRKLMDQLAGAERDIAGWRCRYAELKRDRDAEAREHPMWDVGRALFTEWKKATNHPRSHWTPERFWQCERFLTGERFGATVEERCVWIRRAIAGAQFDAFRTTRRNGSVKAHNDWELLFRSEDKFREFVARAPKGWTP